MVEFLSENPILDYEFIAGKTLKEYLDYISKDTSQTSPIIAENLLDLAIAREYIYKEICKKHLLNGVNILNPNNTFIDAQSTIAKGTTIHSGTTIINSHIDKNCKIMDNCRIENSKISENVVINSSQIYDSEIAKNTVIGPFAHIRPNCKIGENVKVGNFVEIKACNIGDKTKVSHLTYLGDANIGKNVNFGCGSITVNYDGNKKHKTEIMDNAFIGCNTNLVAPVCVGNGAYTAAGSTITHDVPNASLAIARNKQSIIENWKKGL